MSITDAIPEGLRESKFVEFSQRHFSDHTHTNSCPTNFNDQYTGAAGVFEDKNKYNIYNVFKTFSLTRYGSVIINEILKNPDKYKEFKIYRGSLGSTSSGSSAAFDGIVFPHQFPKFAQFPTGGQKIDPLAIILHEFGHTMVFNPSSKQGIQFERYVVINYENTVRKINGYEMRYIYFNGVETINIITGQTKLGKWAFNKEDPTELVEIGSKEAFSQ